MLTFDHSKSDIWTALGFDAVIAHDLITKMGDFTKLFFTNERFSKSFGRTPRSYQIEFILNEVLDIDQTDSAQMFLAGHLLGAFHYMQKDLDRDLLGEDIKGLMKDALKKMKDDSDDF